VNGPLRGSVALATAVLAASALPAVGQAEGTPGAPLRDRVPAWAERWSPGSDLADLHRELFAGVAPPELLTFPAPRVGLFWTAGNPAALPTELEDAHTDFRFAFQRASGDYTRPLDPGAVSWGSVSALGWRTLAEGRGAVIGNAVFDRASLQDSLFANVLVPYASNPFVVMDTIGDPMRRTATRLEGATGWGFGPFALGISLGWKGQRSRTIESPVPRLNRTAASGAVVGVGFEAARGLRIGLHGRWQQAAELLQIRTIAEASRIFQLEGYEEPVPLDLQPALYRRRFERTGYAVGGAVGVDALDATWVLFGQREMAEEDQFIRTTENDPPADRWEANGWTIGGAAQWSLIGGDLLLTFDGRYRTLEGEAARADIQAVVFTVDEQRFAGSADLRWRAGSSWRLGGRAEVRRDSHDRRDLLAGATSDIRSWKTGVAVTLARVFGDRFAVSAGGGFSADTPSGDIPDPDTLGPVYRRFVGPELAIQLTEATGAVGVLALRWQAGAATGVWIRGELGGLDPREASVPLLPDGTRRAWRLSAGAVLNELWP